MASYLPGIHGTPEGGVSPPKRVSHRASERSARSVNARVRRRAPYSSGAQLDRVGEARTIRANQHTRAEPRETLASSASP